MDKEKIILLIVGAIIGFFVSLAKDWLMESKKQKEKYKQFKREKLEELYMLLNEEDKLMTDLTIGMATRYKSKITKHEALITMSEFNKKMDKNIIKRIDMLINLYLKELIAIRKNMNRIRFETGALAISGDSKNNNEVQKKLIEYNLQWNKEKEKLDSRIHSLPILL